MNSQTFEKPIFVILRRLVLVGLIIGVIAKIAYPSWENVMNWNLPDNDDAMRVLQVKAWLDGQGFYDIFNHRLNPPNGGDIHWSRLADLPLASITLLFRLFLDDEMGLKAATFFTPLLLAGVFAISVGKAAEKLEIGIVSLFLGTFLALSTAGPMSYFIAGRVDHHGLQLIFLVLSLWGLFRHDGLGSMVSGILVGLSLTIGFEMVFLLSIMVAWVALIWAFRGNDAKLQTKFFALSFALGSLIGFLINVPPSEFAITANDTLTIAQLFPILTGCAGLWLVAVFLSNARIFLRFFVLGLIGIVVILVAVQFPILFKPLYWQTPPILHRMWISIVVETHSLTRTDIPVQINLGLFAVIASLASLVKTYFIAREDLKNPDLAKDRELDNWILLSSILIIATLFAIFWQARVAGQATALGAIAASAILAGVYKKYGLIRALMIGILLNPLLPSSAAATHAKMFPKKTKYAVGGGKNCEGIKSFANIGAMPSGLLLAPIDVGAQALLSTHHNVLAAPYHRNQGNMISYDIFMSEPNVALEKIHAHNIKYVAICTKSSEVGVIVREAPNSLMKLLQDTRWPDYLKPIPTPKNSDIHAYEVIK